MNNYMRFEDFVDQVKGNIGPYLQGELSEKKIRIGQFRKIGSSYCCMSIDKGPNSSTPIVNLNLFYKDYCNHHPMEELLEAMSEILQEEVPEIDMSIFEQYETVKTRLFFRLSNKEWNREYLRSVPHREFEDLALSCHVLVKHDSEGCQSTPFTREMMERYEISEKQLFEDTSVSSQILFPFTIRPVEINGGRTFHEYLGALTNESGVNGAAALFYPGMFERIGTLAPNGIYLVPTSIHEFLLQKENGMEDIDSMEQSLVKTNMALTESDQWLSEQIYHYDPSKNLFETARQYRNRKIS